MLATRAGSRERRRHPPIRGDPRHRQGRAEIPPIAHVSLTRHDHGHVDTFIAEVQRRPEVLDCFAVTGEADYHLRVVCADLEAYNRFLESFLFRLPGIANVRTNLVLKDIKQETAVPL